MGNSMNAVGAGAVFNAAELAIKAVIVEKHGAIPRKYQNHQLRRLAQQTGLWAELPGELQTYVTEISNFHPEVRYAGEPAHERLVTATTTEQWERLLARSGKLLDFVERKVIEDPAVFSRLNP